MGHNSQSIKVFIVVLRFFQINFKTNLFFILNPIIRLTELSNRTIEAERKAKDEQKLSASLQLELEKMALKSHSTNNSKLFGKSKII